ncbi:ribonuclease D [Geodermatophilus sp. DSM 44513]|uniref:ribonuclease D n=1 Tax=Geodermatophilus sp. DSM 44513 TaxID=1528104 RepID=UPI0028F73F14|nr:ribonuclease D [Geodermatophilus sp. DSM 44513]WNV77832.1 ribonuclease D [Geodermatophilus sp. DSM 44513]
MEPRLYQGDIDQDFFDRARAEGRVAWDIETTGLDWATDRIGTCQLAVAGEIAVVQLGEWGAPDRLRSLLEDPIMVKVFHHAPFDLRFMAHHWKADPANVACTKIASKILDPGLDPRAHSLKPVLERYLGVVIDKAEQRSDWVRGALSNAQVAYAARDVQYLAELHDLMERRAVGVDVAPLLRASYDYLPTRVKLDLMGAEDVYAY